GAARASAPDTARARPRPRAPRSPRASFRFQWAERRCRGALPAPTPAPPPADRAGARSGETPPAPDATARAPRREPENAGATGLPPPPRSGTPARARGRRVDPTRAPEWLPRSNPEDRRGRGCLDRRGDASGADACSVGAPRAPVAGFISLLN